MSHLPFVAAAYGLTLVIVVWLVADVVGRTRRVRARLLVLDPREQRR